MTTYKIILYGAAKVGKSELISQNLNQTPKTEYVPSVCVELTPLIFTSERGNVRFDVWDTAGDPTLRLNFDENDHMSCYKYIEADCIIYISSKGCFNDYVDNDYIDKEFDECLKCAKPNAPVIKVFNLNNGNLYSVPPDHIVINTATNEGCELPFLEAARILSEHADLEFIERPLRIKKIKAPRSKKKIKAPRSKKKSSQENPIPTPTPLTPYSII